MSNIAASYNDLSIEYPDRFIDITSNIQSHIRNLPRWKVVKSPNFSLLEVSNNLEVSHKLLDSGLIQLLDEANEAYQFDFNETSRLDLNDIVIITSKLFRYVFLWLDTNDLLSNTFCSCIYVEKILREILAHKDYKHATLFKFENEDEFVDLQSRLQKYENELKEMVELNDLIDEDRRVFLQNYILTHKVFRSIITGLSMFVSFLVSFSSTGALYEEEDIVTRSQLFEVFQFISSLNRMDFLYDIISSSIWLRKYYDAVNYKDSYDILNEFLNIIKNLFDFQKLLFKSYNINLNDPLLSDNFTASPTEVNYDNDLKFLLQIINSIQIISDKETYFETISSSQNVYSKDCFSIGIQKRLSNSRPICSVSDLSVIHFDLISRKYFLSFFDSMKVLLSLMRNGLHFQSLKLFFKKIEMNSENNSVLLRGFLRLFLVRDNNTICGDPKAYFGNLLLANMNFISGTASKNLIYFFGGSNKAYRHGMLDYVSPLDMISKSFSYIQPDEIDSALEIVSQFSFLGVSDKTKFKTTENLRSVYLEFFSQLESTYFELVGNTCNNPSRQRQVYSMLIVSLDNLQVIAKRLEAQITEEKGIKDSVDFGNSACLESFVYYEKLLALLEYNLKGIELDLYRFWEFPLIFCMNSYFLELLQQLIERILQVYNFKVQVFETRILELEYASNTELNKKFMNWIELYKTDFNFFNAIKVILNSKKQFFQFKSRLISIIKKQIADIHYVKKQLGAFMKYYTGAYHLNLALFHLFSKLDLINPSSMDKEKKLMLQRLRLKLFSSIGDPDQINVAYFEARYNIDNLNFSKESVISDFEKAKTNLIDYLNSFQKSGITQEETLGSFVEKDVSGLISTCDFYIEKLGILGGLDGTKMTYKSLATKYHKFYPLIELEQK